MILGEYKYNMPAQLKIKICGLQEITKEPRIISATLYLCSNIFKWKAQRLNTKYIQDLTLEKLSIQHHTVENLTQPQSRGLNYTTAV